MAASCSQLDDSVLQFLGVKVYVHPIYGWGWVEIEGGHSSGAPVDVPNGFSLKVAEFFDWNGERRGGIGHIEEVGHVYDGQWLLFYTRQVGRFDFTNIVGHYNIHIGLNRPTLHPHSKDPRMAEAWPLPHFPGCRSVWGFGQIGATKELIENKRAEVLRAWEARCKSS